MAHYDGLISDIGHCLGNPNFEALKAVDLLRKSLMIIQHLQSVIRDYNPDDAIFDDEKPVLPIMPVSNDDAWPETKFSNRVKVIPIQHRDGVVQTPEGVGKGMIWAYDKGTMI